MATDLELLGGRLNGRRRADGKGEKCDADALRQ
jgi:hypothetical protein